MEYQVSQIANYEQVVLATCQGGAVTQQPGPHSPYHGSMQPVLQQNLGKKHDGMIIYKKNFIDRYTDVDKWVGILLLSCN